MILLIETSHKLCSVAVCQPDGQIVWEKQDAKLLKHAETLPVLVEEAVKKFKDIQAIALSQGPGSYTGLRIGASLAQGLCFAKAWPLIAVPTHLQLLATCTQTSIALLYAGRSEAYMATGQGYVMGAISSQIIDQEWINSQEVNAHIVGDCIHLFEGLTHEFSLENIEPTARLLAPIAAHKWSKKEFEDLAYFTPTYAKEFIPGVSKKFKL